MSKENEILAIIAFCECNELVATNIWFRAYKNRIKRRKEKEKEKSVK